jgi:transcriptional regulator with XRE-family HTH domain
MTNPVADIAEPGDVAVGARVREIRQQSGLSLRAVASALGISASALSQIETGRTRPSISRVHQIATEPNVPLSTLFAPDLDTPRAEGKTPAATLSTSVSYDSSICVQKTTETPTIHLDNGIRWDRISQGIRRSRVPAPCIRPARGVFGISAAQRQGNSLRRGGNSQLPRRIPPAMLRPPRARLDCPARAGWMSVGRGVGREDDPRRRPARGGGLLAV